MPKLEDRGEIFKGSIVGPNGIDFYKEPEFDMPKGYVAWCHRCGDANFIGHHIETEINGKRIPGVGFKTIEEAQAHNHEYHDYRKVKVL